MGKRKSTRSTRNKGRQFEFWCRDSIARGLNIPATSLNLRGKSAPGCDLWASDHSYSKFPYCVEAKNRRKLNIFQCYEQAVINTYENFFPVVMLHRDRHYLATEDIALWLAKLAVLYEECPHWVNKVKKKYEEIKASLLPINAARFEDTVRLEAKRNKEYRLSKGIKR